MKKENEFLGKKMTKEEMKKIMGGLMNDSGWCSATAICSNGTTVTLVCENAQAGCVGIDSSNSNDGYAYCQEDGVITFNHC